MLFQFSQMFGDIYDFHDIDIKISRYRYRYQVSDNLIHPKIYRNDQVTMSPQHY